MFSNKMNTMEDNYELAKWLAGEMTETELKAFQKTPEYNTYVRIADYSSLLHTPTFDQDKMYQKVVTSEKKTKKVIQLNQSWIFKIAASLLLFIGIGYSYVVFSTTSEIASNGEKTIFQLPDNSEVVLNSGSKIKYNKWNWNTHRKLNLTGEAYFEVAKGKKFEVETNLGTVTVLGTHFNVKARDKRFDVTCYEGLVKVNFKDQSIVITHGESVTFENEMQLDGNVNSSKPEWVDGDLVFNNEKINAIIKELNRHYNTTIELKNISSNQLFTGSIPSENLEEALEILASSYHLQTKKINSNTIILEVVNVSK